MSDHLLVDFFAKVDIAKEPDRALNQLACHIFLFTLSGINFIYLFFIGYLGTGQTKRNFLQFMAMLGALMQMGSCLNSLWRYNIGEEYNYFIANAGAVFGLISGFINTSAVSPIWFHTDANRKRKWAICCFVIFLANAFCMFMEFRTFDKTHFDWFRGINAMNTPYTGITCFIAERGLKNGKIKIDPNIIRREDCIKTFRVMWISLLFLFFAYMPNITLFDYVAGGLTFGCVNVATFFMGQFDDYYDNPFGGETQPLLSQ